MKTLHSHLIGDKFVRLFGDSEHYNTTLTRLCKGHRFKARLYKFDRLC